MNPYAPEGRYLWDPWFIRAGGTYHMFHLQSDRSGDPAKRHHDAVSIGHASSDDLSHWEERPSALEPGPRLSWDDLSLWTGSAINRDGRYYLLYTGRSFAAPWVQKVGLATSSNLDEWNKHPGNPVLEADPSYYHMDNELNALGIPPAWRDPYLFLDPRSGTYYAAMSARTGGRTREYNACVGIAQSEDFIHWEALPPLLAPHRYDQMEVPQLVYHEDVYYLFFSAAPQDYSPEWAAVVGTAHGLHCYWSPRLFGEYEPVNGNGVVLDSSTVLGLRLIERTEQGYVAVGWLNENERGDFIGAVSAPVAIRIDRASVVAKAA